MDMGPGQAGDPVPALTVREARDYTEALAAGELVKTAYDARRRGVPAYRDHLREIGPRMSRSNLLVALDHDDRLLGSVTFALAGTPYAFAAVGGEAELRMLAVVPGEPDSGAVERLLVEECIRRAERAGREAVVLTLLADDGTPDRYYRRRGFAQVRNRTFTPFPGITLVVYRLALPAGSAQDPATGHHGLRRLIGRRG